MLQQICVPQYMHTEEGKNRKQETISSPQKIRKLIHTQRKSVGLQAFCCLLTLCFFSSLPDSCGFSREEERETDKVELEEEEELCIRAEQHWPVLHSLGDSSQLRWEH